MLSGIQPAIRGPTAQQIPLPRDSQARILEQVAVWREHFSQDGSVQALSPRFGNKGCVTAEITYSAHVLTRSLLGRGLLCAVLIHERLLKGALGSARRRGEERTRVGAAAAAAAARPGGGDERGPAALQPRAPARPGVRDSGGQRGQQTAATSSSRSSPSSPELRVSCVSGHWRATREAPPCLCVIASVSFTQIFQVK